MVGFGQRFRMISKARWNFLLLFFLIFLAQTPVDNTNIATEDPRMQGGLKRPLNIEVTVGPAAELLELAVATRSVLLWLSVSSNYVMNWIHASKMLQDPVEIMTRSTCLFY